MSRIKDQSINISGSVNGVINTGNNAKIINNTPQDDNELGLDDVLIDITSSLNEKYSDSSDNDKKIVFKLEIQNMISNDPDLKDRFLNAIKSGSVEVVKVLTNNPFISITIETLKGWLQAKK